MTRSDTIRWNIHVYEIVSEIYAVEFNPTITKTASWWDALKLWFYIATHPNRISYINFLAAKTVIGERIKALALPIPDVT